MQALLLLRLLPWIMQQPFAASYWAFIFGVTALATAPLRTVGDGDTGTWSVRHTMGENKNSWLVRTRPYPRIKMREHKTARRRKRQQSSASGALQDEIQFSVSARPASGGRLR
jgi:hypothetical protein